MGNNYPWVSFIALIIVAEPPKNTRERTCSPVLETALQGLGAKLCEHLESVNPTKWMHAECSTLWQGVCQIRQVDPKVKNTASLTFNQTQKSELRCRAARFFFTHLVNTRDSTQTRRCGPLSDCATAIFRARSAQCLVCEDALSGRPEGPLRHAIAWSSILHSLGKSKAKLCDNHRTQNAPCLYKRGLNFEQIAT